MNTHEIARRIAEKAVQKISTDVYSPSGLLDLGGKWREVVAVIAAELKPLVEEMDKLAGSDYSFNALTQLRAQLAEAKDEFRELQDAIRDEFIKSGVPDNLIDGKGSDAGPIEFTMAEFRQGIGYIEEQRDQLKAQLAEAQKERDAFAQTVGSKNQIERGHLCEKVLVALAGARIATPEETYGDDINWAVSDAIRAIHKQAEIYRQGCDIIADLKAQLASEQEKGRKAVDTLRWYAQNAYVSHLILEDAGTKAQATLRELEATASAPKT